MIASGPSSPLKKAPPDSEELSDAKTKDPFIDKGLPIPDAYHLDIVRAMIQNPFRVYVYWEAKDESFEALTRYFPPSDVASFQVVLRLIELDKHTEAFFEASKRGNRWIMVFPDHEYEFEIGVRSPIHGYIALVRSNRLRTPRATVSTETLIEDDDRRNVPEFAEVMEASGFSEGKEDSLIPLSPAPSLFTGGTENLTRPPSGLHCPGLPGAPSSPEMVREG